MSRLDKLFNDIIRVNKNLRFDDLVKALLRMGYTHSQPKGGSSHHIFRKAGCAPISLPKPKIMHMDIVYIRLVKKAISDYLNDGDDKN